MNKKHKFLTILLIVILCVSMVVTLIACDKPEESIGEVKDSSEFIANGNFEITTSDTFPKIPGSWTGSAGSTSSGNSPEIDDAALVSGVIDTSNDVYEKNKKLWNRLGNPGKNGKDNNILMIYNKKDTSYKYTSGSFSLGANKIFQIEVSVKTVNHTDSSYGANIKIGGDAFIEFNGIKTNGSWTTYRAMVKTSNISSNSLSVELSNGKGGKNDNMLSNGYAFFDNVVVSEVEDDENGKTAEEKYNDFKAQAAGNATYGMNDLTYGDLSFINISGSSNPFTARKWTGVSSSGENGETAPTGSDYLERGVVNIDAEDIPTAAADVKPHTDGLDTKFLMLNNKDRTAYGYRSDARIKIAAGKYYKVSVWVMTRDIDKNGAYFMLKTSTDKNEQIKSIDNIVTDGEWSEISFFVKGDQRRNKEIYLQVGLGKGGKNHAGNVKGVAFFDDLSVSEVDEDAYLAAGEDERADLESTLGDGQNLISSKEIYNANNFTEAKYDKNDGIPDSMRGTLTIEDGSITITNDTPSITKYKYTQGFNIKANNHYRLSFKLATENIDEDLGIELIFYKKVSNGDDVEIAKVTDFNIEDVDDSALVDGFVEMVLLVQGDLKEDSDIYFQVNMGSGSNLTPDTLVKGSVVMKDFEMYRVNYSDYTSESSSTYVKKHSFKSESHKISNADFNQIDISQTKTNYDDFDEADFLSGNTKGAFGLPQNWTNTSTDELENLYAGVYNIDNAAQSAALNITGDITSNWLSPDAKGNTNLLAISTNKAPGNQIKNPWGFTSPSMSLSKGLYYEISVWAYLYKGSNATINLLSSSKTVIEQFKLTSVSTGWKEYKFFVNAGFDNSTIYMSLMLGDSTNSDEIVEGTVLFDLPRIVEITSDFYENKVKEIADEAPINELSTTFSIITFDNATSNSDEAQLDTPDGWEGSHADTNAPSGQGKSVAGVYNRDHGSREWFGGKYEKDDEEIDIPPISQDELINIMNTAPYLDITHNFEEIIEGSSNNNVLVINNNAASEYTYTTTLAEGSLTANKFYEISVYVLTYNVASDKTAKIQLKLHNSTYEFAKNTDRGINVNTNKKWQRYSFFIATEDKANIDNIQLSISLGAAEEANYVQGYLFVDNISISEIDEDRFNTQVPEDKFPAELGENQTYDKAFTATKHRIVFTEEDLNKEPEEEKESEPDPLLWLYITSGIIGGLIVIVVIVFLFRKFNVIGRLFSKKKNLYEKGSETYNHNKVEINKANAQKRDINKKHQD